MMSVNVFRNLLGGLICLLLASSAAVASEPCASGCAKLYCPPVCGPESATCHPEYKEETIKESCWQVERDFVCIPPVRFPWMCCDDLPCPRIRQVNKLKAHKYERTECRFGWSLKKLWPCVDSCAPGELCND